MEWLAQAAEIAKDIMGIVAFLALVFKPLREWLFGIKDLREAQKCMLRTDMLHTYYKHKDETRIRQHEKENYLLEYAAYKRLGGNSFIDDITEKVRDWEVVS